RIAVQGCAASIAVSCKIHTEATCYNEAMALPSLSSELALSPPLKWAGGKRWLVPRLNELWMQHRHRRFVEPFVGGLAVALGLRPGTALLNDSNPHLINFYKWLQCGLIVEIPMANDSELFYDHRRRFNYLIKNG